MKSSFLLQSLGVLPDPEPVRPENIASTLITSIRTTGVAPSAVNPVDESVLPTFLRSAVISQLSLTDSKLELSRPIFNDQGLLVNPANLRGVGVAKPVNPSTSTFGVNAGRFSFQEGQRVEVFLQLVDTQKRAFVREDVKWKVELRRIGGAQLPANLYAGRNQQSAADNLPEIKTRFDMNFVSLSRAEHRSHYRGFA